MTKTTIVALFSLIFMVFHAELITKGAASGLLLWYSSVVPALFPFMVLSAMLSVSGGISRLVRPFAVIFRFSGLSPEGIYVLLTGLFCGCPMGAKTCADFLAENRISPGEARFLFDVPDRICLPDVCRAYTSVLFCLCDLYAASAACHSGIPDLPKRFPAPLRRPFFFLQSEIR